MRPLLCLILTLVSADSAPVSVVKAKPHYRAHMECGQGVGCFNTQSVDMAIEYRNDSGREIAAVKFQVVFIDGVGDRHPVSDTFTASKKLAPGKTHLATWENLINPTAPKMEAEVVKVLFKDGSTWEAASDKQSSMMNFSQSLTQVFSLTATN